jgi:MFS family permease
LGVNSWWTLALVRFYHGFATAIFIPVAEASIAELFPTKRGERISLFNSATAGGRALAPFLGGYLLFATNQSFFSLYVAVGIAGVTAFAIALLFLAEKRNLAAEQVQIGKSPRKMFGGWLTLIKNTSVLGVSFVQAVQYVVKLDLFSVGIILGSEIVALVIARPFIGRISDRVGRIKPIIAGIVASCFLVAAIPFTNQFPVLLVLAAAYGVSFAAVLSSTSPMVCDLVPAPLVGASMGFLSTTMDIGQTLGPIVSGVIFATNLRYTGMFLSLSFLLIISTIVFLLAKKRPNER